MLFLQFCFHFIQAIDFDPFLDDFSLFFPVLSFLSQKSNLRGYFFAFRRLVGQSSTATDRQMAYISQIKLWRNFILSCWGLSQLVVKFPQDSIIIFDKMSFFLNIWNFFLLNLTHFSGHLVIQLKHESLFMFGFFGPFFNIFFQIYIQLFGGLNVSSALINLCH